MYILTSFGWLINIPKHEPIAQNKIFLGLIINSISIEFDFPQSKLDQFFDVLKLVKSQSVMAVRFLAWFLGLLNLFSKALGQVARLMTRNLYFCFHPTYFSKERWGL